MMAINWPPPSLPGLTRQSIFFLARGLAKRMDPRVKPAGDALGHMIRTSKSLVQPSLRSPATLVPP